MNYQTEMKLKRLKNQPFITYALLGISIIVFLGLELTGGSENILNLVNWGAMVRPLVAQNYEYWRFITPMFLHIGFMHIILNMVTLYYIGAQVEAIYGHWRYLGIYLLSGIAGNIASFAFGTPNSVSAGASTALFGLFGAFVILGRHFRDNPAIMYMVQRYSMFIVINLLFNLFSSSVDMMGHVGGLIGGLLVATAFAVPNREEAFNKHERIMATLIFIFLVVICLLLGFKKYGLPV
ncbi:TPA: rhomboid family intramembrane serine protease [Enterococcus faecalis]|uniref:rhomboid family intramembrane serine protease n=1 Tax=Enterococcus faecalis TaxID=1351 RepID=UPI000E066038|nr:rhomboid family intramembrane serine protease [Enterococcus faecalis]STP98736.1 Uncharacterized membrane protein (homolog of Drosophila rhomboid) [Enterococcus faecalis]HAP5243350.1 rhomboid family intramembrane serine protease [Enterococcus faecalis]